MTPLLRFESAIESAPSQVTLRMARLWAGVKVRLKDEAVAATIAALKSPERVHLGMAQLQPFEKNALAFLERYSAWR
jgi:hypothetical protein